MFACRMCRREVVMEDGAYNHVGDGSPACIVTMDGKPMPDYDRHEVVEDPTTLAPEKGKKGKKSGKGSEEDVAAMLQAEEEVNPITKAGE